MNDTVKRVTEMEAILDECRETLDELEQSLNRLQGMQDRMGQLFRYYGSSAWYEDREKDLPLALKSGVLSEDLVYDTVTDARDLSFRMLEMATDILKNKI